MTLSRKIPLPESRLEVSAPPARFESGRRAPGVFGRPLTDRSRSIHGAFAPNVNCPRNRGRSREPRVGDGGPCDVATELVALGGFTDGGGVQRKAW